jgi:methylated-DNA-[protein]-cysteine S-methyltransferase
MIEKPNQLLRDIVNELIKIFNGQKSNKKRFNLDLSNLSTYSKKVLEITNLVPVGYVSTYKKIAEVAGGSARSVGNVEVKNPLPLLIPCHRIVCSDFRAGGYGFGEKMKIKILRKEDRGHQENDEIIVNNKKLILYPVKKIK